jgi:hypothetical protein
MHEGDMTRKARLKGRQVEVKGTIEISFCMRGSTDVHATRCYVTKEWDPPFDVVMAKANLPKETRRSLKRV